MVDRSLSYHRCQQKILLIPTWPEQVNEDTVGEGVCAVGDAREELGPPERRDLQRHDGHQRKIDEPDQTGGSEM